MENGKNIKLLIFDTNGFYCLHSKKKYWKGDHGIILINDAICKVSFVNLKKQMYDIRKEVSYKTPIILVGNKIDDEDNRVISREEGKNFAEENGLMFSECSAKTGENIDNIFNELTIKIEEKENEEKIKRQEIENSKNTHILKKYISF